MKIINNISDRFQKRKSVYLSTHEFITRSITDFSDEQLALMIKKSHPIRKIQDKYCYIHTKIKDQKIFTSRQHKILESTIRNNLKLFSLFYINVLPDHEIEMFMLREAILQHKNLKSMNYLQVILNRHTMLSYFLSYAFSRSVDYYNNPDENNAS